MICMNIRVDLMQPWMERLVDADEVVVRETSIGYALYDGGYVVLALLFGRCLPNEARARENGQSFGLKAFENGFRIPLTFGFSRNLFQAVIYSD